MPEANHAAGSPDPVPGAGRRPPVLGLKSIRWSLQLWHAGLLAIVLLVFGSASYYSLRHTRYQDVDNDLLQVAVELTACLRFPPPQRGPRERGPHGPPADRSDVPRSFEDLLSMGGHDRPESGEPPERRERRGGPPGFPPELEGLDLPPALARRFGDGSSGTLYYVVWNAQRKVYQTSCSDGEIPDPGETSADVAAGRRGPADDGEKLAPPDWESESAPMDRPPRLPGRPPRPELPRIRQRGEFREAYVDGPFETRILVGKSLRPDEAELRRLAWTMVITGAGVLAVGLGGGWLLSLRAVRPIQVMTAAAQEISASNLTRRIELDDMQSELGTLAGVLNETFDRLETAFQQQVRFTADASHELRTPLTVIHTHAQLALARDRSPEEYRKTLETCLRASGRMKELVDALLMLARADGGRLALNRGPCDLGAIARDCAALLASLAAQRGVTITTDVQPAPLEADATRLAQVVTNLVTNAIRYNVAGGRVDVAVVGDATSVVLRIADTGVGIPPADQPHIFERFYRVDASRNREDGGSGLGLAICKSIVEAHGGSIALQSVPGQGTTFSVILPRAMAGAA